MRLILSGGGSGKEVEESYQLFAESVKGGKVLYVPLAWEDETYAGCLDWLKGDLKPFGVNNIEMVTNANQITKEKLNTVKGVFIGGGNTYKLLKYLEESCAFENLKEYAMRNDTVVMGGSAGALIWGESIDTCKDDGLGIKYICDINNVGLKDTSGFKMLNGYSLLVHYKKKEEQNGLTNQRIERLLEEGYKLVCLPEETSLVVEDKKCYIIGSKPAEIILKNQRKIATKNQTISL